VRGGDLHAVEPAFDRYLGSPGIALDDLLDLLLTHLSRLDAEAGARHWGRRQRGGTWSGGDLLATAVEELDEETRATGAHGRHHSTVCRREVGQPAVQRV
jgi:hypothetical protein